MHARFEDSVAFVAAEAAGTQPVERPREHVYLYPGQVFASAAPARITTILGSCIAVCLFDAGRRIGGMNHFMLPQFAGMGTSNARFGNVAMAELFAKLTAAGARKGLLQARVFGGSCMFGQSTAPGHLGSKNELFARETLAAHGIPIVQIEAGGGRGRKLVFHTDEGKAWLTSI